jgi:hypothetical protein
MRLNRHQKYTDHVTIPLLNWEFNIAFSIRADCANLVEKLQPFENLKTIWLTKTLYREQKGLKGSA